MAQITINYSQIEQAASELASTSSTMENEFNNIQNIINSTIPDVWGGDAAMTYKDGLNKIIAKFPDFVRAVQNEKAFLDNAKSNYTSVDKATNDVAL